MRETILKKLEEHSDLPVLPDIMLKLERLLADPDTDLTTIAKLIESDQVLSGKLLKVANSAFFRRGPNEIKTVPMAVVQLGLRQIRDVALSLNVCRLFTSVKALDTRAFWKHSLGVALASKLIAQQMGLSEEACELSFLAGLMHDVGVLVFATIIPDQYGELLAEAADSEKPLAMLERERFGISHPELGALFIEKWWEMDPNIVQAVKEHPVPFNGTGFQNTSAQIVNIADGLCAYCGIDSGIDSPESGFNPGAFDSLGLTLDDADTIMENVNQSLIEAEQMLSV